ncbi:contact-dependent growth inhibition system immunity protein [Streptomyces sp. NPDC093591]|uniref:contact-dependent growth inhibition system immunity protein n=1 Tax=Streptomyces sp. NPDC093591 TaxID=3366044 RepID=UPI00380BF3C5
MSQALPPEPRFYELSDLLKAYAYSGFTFTDTAETPGPGLASYLRIAARDPARAETAVHQIEDLLSVGLFSEEIADDVEDLPHIRPPMGTTVEDCLRIARDHLNRLLEDPSRIPQTNPQNSWEWNERFPQLSQFLGGYLHRNYSEFHARPEDAIDEYVTEVDPEDRTQAAQEITELLTMVSSDQELGTAATALGLDLLPPEGMSLRQWLELIRRRITAGDQPSDA